MSSDHSTVDTRQDESQTEKASQDGRLVASRTTEQSDDEAARLQAELERLQAKLAAAEAETEAAKAATEAAEAATEAAKAEAEAERKAAKAATEAAEAATEAAKAEAEAERKAKEEAIGDLKVIHTMERTFQQVSPVGNKRKYKMPSIKINGAVDPHNTKEESGNKKAKGTQKIEEDKKANPMAKSLSHCAWEGVEDVVIPVRFRESPDDSRGRPITSTLGSKADDGKGGTKLLEYTNEACIQDFVKALVEDMVKCLGLAAVLDVHVEMSIFSGVPDVVVVSRNGTPLSFIEVKSPERDGKEGEVFEARDIWRQVWNYLMGLKKIGHTVPIACLATYNKLAIITTEDLAKNEAHQDFLSEMAKKFSEGEIVTHVSGEVTMSKCEDDEKPSPTKCTTKLIELAGDTFGEEDNDADPNIFMSNVFCEGKVPQGLLVALWASYCHNKESSSMESDKLYVVDEGDSLSGLFLPRVSADGMTWTTIRKGVTANYNAFPRGDAAEFYLLARVGQGSCGKVHLASTTSGVMCAMKLYIPKRSNQFNHEQRKQEDQNNLKDKEAARNEELGRWKLLYPKKRVSSRTINGLPALLMQYGQQLDRSERTAKLDEIKSELERFAHKGFAYKNSDLRWRHVVLHNGQILLVDLESLEKEENVEGKSEAALVKLVENQMERLKSRIGEEQEVLDSQIY